jgi:hypothetical protein
MKIRRAGEDNIRIYPREIDCKELNKTELDLNTFQGTVYMMV